VRAVASEAEVAASRDTELHADALAAVLDAAQATAMSAWRAGRREEAMRLTDAHLAELRRAQELTRSPALAQRVTELEADRRSFESEAADSEEGRAFSLGRGAMRRARAEAF
jgi:hypothetical protein